MADEQDQDTAGEGAKKLNLRSQPNVPAPTSLGIFYARHFTVGDLRAFSRYVDQDVQKESEDLKQLGEQALKTFVVMGENRADKTPALTDDNYQQLTTEDLTLLSAAVAKAWDRTLPEGEPVEALGAVLFDYLVEHRKRFRETAEIIKNKLNPAFGSLSDTVRTALGDNLTGLSALRESLKVSPAVEAIRKAQDEHKHLYKGLSALHDHLQPQGFAEVLRKRQEDLSGGGSGGSWALGEDKERNLGSVISVIPSLLPPLPRPPSFEDTPAGRTAARAASASEEAAQQMREVAGLVGEMSGYVERLQTTFLTDVLPQWYQNLKESANTTNTTLTQAKESIRWAKWALVASVIVTILATSWQLWVAREYKLEDDKQQAVTENLLREQLRATQELNKQLAEDSMQLREELARLRQAAKTAAVKDPGTAKPKNQ